MSKTISMKDRHAEFVTLGGTKKLSSFKTRAALEAAIAALAPAPSSLTKTMRQRLRRAMKRGAVKVKHESGKRWSLDAKGYASLFA